MTPSVIGENRPELSKLSVIRTLWKGRYVLLSVWILVTVSSGLYIRRMPSLYSADALILIQPPTIPEKYVSSDNAEVLERLATVKQAVYSTANLDQLIRDVGLCGPNESGPALAALRERVRANSWISPDKEWVSNHTVQLHAGYQAPEPQLAAVVANRLAALLIREETKGRTIRAEGTSEFIKDRLAEAKAKLDSLEATLSDYKVQHHGALPQQENALLATLSALQSELQGTDAALDRARRTRSGTEAALSVADARLKLLEQSDAPADPVAGVIPARPSFERLADPPQSQSAAIQAQINQLRTRYNEEHPEIRRLKAELASARRMEREEVAHAPSLTTSLTPSTTSTSPGDAAPVKGDVRIDARRAAEIGAARERVANLTAQLNSSDADLARLTESRERVASQIESNQSKISTLPLREQELARILRDYEISRTNYTSLLNKKLSADMASDLERQQVSEEFNLIGPAKPPTRPTRPNRPMLFTVSSASGLFLGLAMVVALEMRRAVFLGEWELPAGTVVLARLPIVDVRKRAGTGGHVDGVPKRSAKLQQTLLVSCGAVLVVVITGFWLVRHLS